MGIPVEVCQTNRSPTRSDVLYSFGRSLAYGQWTGCSRRSLDPQAGVYSALGPKAGVSSGPRARVFYKCRSHGFCECQMFVWSRTCDPTLTRARTLARTRTHVGPLLLVLIASRPPLASSDRPRISSTTYFTSPQISIWVIVKLF